jgi:hypothetical protein
MRSFCSFQGFSTTAYYLGLFLSEENELLFNYQILIVLASNAEFHQLQTGDRLLLK